MKRINSQRRYDLRRGLCNAFGGLCAYCRKKIGMAGTVDHYLPQALGGTNARTNLRWCCTECNGAKADMHPQEWEQRKPPLVLETLTKAQRRTQLLVSISQKARA